MKLKPVRSHVSSSKIVAFYFLLSLSLFVSRISAYKNEHRKRILGRQAAKSTQRAPLIFFIFLPLQVILFGQLLVVKLNAIQNGLSFWKWVGLRLHFLCLSSLLLVLGWSQT